MMDIKQYIDNHILHIALNGDLDASSSIQLDEVFDTAFKHNQYDIEVDFSQINYISSAGIGVFISHLETSRENNGNIILKNMQPNVYNVFDLLGLQKIMIIINPQAQSK